MSQMARFFTSGKVVGVFFLCLYLPILGYSEEKSTQDSLVNTTFVVGGSATALGGASFWYGNRVVKDAQAFLANWQIYWVDDLNEYHGSVLNPISAHLRGRKTTTTQIASYSNIKEMLELFPKATRKIELATDRFRKDPANYYTSYGIDHRLVNNSVLFPSTRVGEYMRDDALRSIRYKYQYLIGWKDNQGRMFSEPFLEFTAENPQARLRELLDTKGIIIEKISAGPSITMENSIKNVSKKNAEVAAVGKSLKRLGILGLISGPLSMGYAVNNYFGTENLSPNIIENIGIEKKPTEIIDKSGSGPTQGSGINISKPE